MNKKSKKKPVKLELTATQIRRNFNGCRFLKKDDEHPSLRLLSSGIYGVDDDGELNEEQVQLMIYCKQKDGSVDLLDFDYPDFKNMTSVVEPIKDAIQGWLKRKDLDHVDLRFPSKAYEWDQVTIYNHK